MKLSYKNSKLDIKINKDIFSKALGLMFSKKIKDNEAFLFINNKESLLKSMVHSLFVFYPIKVIWLNNKFEIVDIKILKPFTLVAIPKAKAKYILEVSPKALKQAKIGTKLRIERFKYKL